MDFSRSLDYRRKRARTATSIARKTVTRKGAMTPSPYSICLVFVVIGRTNFTLSGSLDIPTALC